MSADILGPLVFHLRSVSVVSIVAGLAIAGQQLVWVVPGQTAGQVAEMMDVQGDVVAAQLGAFVGLATPAIALEDFQPFALPAASCSSWE